MLPAPETWYAGLRLRILPLHVAIRWSRPAALPPHIMANVLRGAFNITFRRLVCPPEWMNNACPPCPLYSQCPYGRLFEPTPPADSNRLRLQADLPRPFILKPPLLESPGSAAENSLQANGNPLASRPPAERLEFGLVLVGTAVDQLPHFIVTLAELGRVGMGPHRIPFTIESVTTDAPTHPGNQPGSREHLYDPATHTFRAPQHVVQANEFLAKHELQTSNLPSPPPRGRGAGGEGAGSDLAAPSDSPPRLTLRFLTPTLIRTGSGVDSAGRRIPAREVRDRPEFGTLIRRLRDRLSALCTFFGEGPWIGPDFGEMGRLADTVRLIDSQTEWIHRSRYSTRTHETHEISGLTGAATYEFESPAQRTLFLPLLKCGEQIHLGKHAVWGNGWVEIENENTNRFHG